MNNKHDRKNALHKEIVFFYTSQIERLRISISPSRYKSLIENK